MTNRYRLGIDLGGTKIEGVVLLRDGTIAARRRVPTPAGNYGATIECIANLVNALEHDVGARVTVGVGCPGAISPRTGLIKNANSTCLNGMPLQSDLEKALGRPVRLANDANCFALSEASDGAGAGAETVFGVILGTGVGGAIVHRGNVLTGANAIAGEWGHNGIARPAPDEIPGPACYCGKTGCVETFLSGPAFAIEHQARTGQLRDAEAIALGASRGEPDCVASVHRYAERLARNLANVINIIDPQVIVLGGGLSKMAALYEMVPQLWPRYVFSDHVATELRPPVHGDASGVRGAAWLWSVEEASGTPEVASFHRHHPFPGTA